MKAFVSGREKRFLHAKGIGKLSKKKQRRSQNGSYAFSVIVDVYGPRSKFAVKSCVKRKNILKMGTKFSALQPAPQGKQEPEVDKKMSGCPMHNKTKEEYSECPVSGSHSDINPLNMVNNCLVFGFFIFLVPLENNRHFETDGSSESTARPGSAVPTANNQTSVFHS